MEQTEIRTKRNDLFQIPVKNIVVKEGFNSRRDFGDLDELAAQIEENGVLNPITVKKLGNELYQLVDGERRFRAVNKILEKDENKILRIPAIVVPANYSEIDLLVQQAIRNEGKKFSEYEWGVLCQKMMTIGGLGVCEVAKRLGKNSAQVSHWIGIISIENDELRDMAKNGEVTGGTLRDVLRGNPDEQQALDEVKEAKANAIKKGKTKVTLDDFSKKGKTLVYKNTVTIKTGFQLLESYVKDYIEEKNNEGLNVIVDINVIYGAIKDGKMIDEALDLLKTEPMAQAV